MEGEKLSIKAVDDNPHDADAVEVRRGEELLGFIPRALAGRLRARGEREWTGEVVQVLRGETWGLRVVVREIDGDAHAVKPPLPTVEVSRPSGKQRAGRDQGSIVKVGPKRVKALSGRDLGVLLRESDGKVLVRAEDGRETTYPAGVVTVEGV